MKQKILVSACLIGKPVRYDGTAETSTHPVLQQWLAENKLVAVCPELLAGFSVPRPPVAIRGEGGGLGVLEGRALPVRY